MPATELRQISEESRRQAIATIRRTESKAKTIATIPSAPATTTNCNGTLWNVSASAKPLPVTGRSEIFAMALSKFDARSAVETASRFEGARVRLRAEGPESTVPGRMSASPSSVSDPTTRAGVRTRLDSAMTTMPQAANPTRAALDPLARSASVNRGRAATATKRCLGAWEPIVPTANAMASSMLNPRWFGWLVRPNDRPWPYAPGFERATTALTAAPAVNNIARCSHEAVRVT